MKKIILVVLMAVMVMGVSMEAKAALQNLGTDSAGNQLIYDTDFDITWYDYTNSYDTWQNQVSWADALSVTFGSTTYTDWRLPTTVDGPYVWGYDGTTTAGYNITSSELGHLFYTELGNSGYYDTSGNPTGCPGGPNYCLTNTGDFQNLQSYVYWSGTEYSANPASAWGFGTDYGYQDDGVKDDDFYAIAVRPGLAVVPEPMSMVLFGVGGVVLVARRKLRKTA